MENIDFIKEILMSDYEYWVVARKQEYREYFETKRGDDAILLILIPHNIRRGLNVKEIMLSDLEELYRSEVSNIHISENYPPFQWGITMRDIYKGYPVKTKIKKFLIDALSLKSNSIYDYKALIEEPAAEVSDTTTPNKD